MSTALKLFWSPERGDNFTETTADGERDADAHQRTTDPASDSPGEQQDEQSHGVPGHGPRNEGRGQHQSSTFGAHQQCQAQQHRPGQDAQNDERSGVPDRRPHWPAIAFKEPISPCAW